MRRRHCTVQRRLSALLLVGVAAAAVFTVTATVRAPAARGAHTLGELGRLIDNAQAKKDRISTDIAGIDKRLNAIEAKLSSLQERIDVVSKELEEQQAVYEQLHDELVIKQRELRKAERELAWQQMVFNERVVDAYKMGDLDYLDVLLASNGYDDFVTRLQLVKRLVDSDDDLVGELTVARNVVEQQKKVVQADTRRAQKLRDRLRERNDELVALKAEHLAAQASAKQDRQAKSTALAAVETDIRAWQAQEARLASESQGLAGVINGLAGDGDGKATGSMVWPCAGSVSSPFGWRIHPIFHVRKFHTGIDIGAAYGTPIRAADGGRVIYASWMSGYGNTTIVDHGRGISTLYAHQSRIRITSGPVTRGQIIGYVGSTGYSTGPHLHFEVRVNGNPVDPMGYL